MTVAETVVRIALADGATACAVAGPKHGSAPGVLFLHGWTLDHRMWAPQLAGLGGAFRVAALDRRGFGASNARAGLAQEADDVVRALDQLGMARATIVGMSQAGRVALDFALRFSDRLDALVLQGAPLGGVTPGPEPEETIPIVEYAALARAGRFDEMKRRWRAHPLMRTMSAQAAEAAEAMVRDYEGRDLGAASYLRDAEPQDLARISAQALVITGAEDTPWRRRSGDALAQALPNARRAEIEGAGHLCNLCRPEAYNALLRDFVLEAAR